MDDNKDQSDEAEQTTTFFNRGRRIAAAIVKDNEQLRAKIRRLEKALRGAAGAGSPRVPEGGSPDER
jgi:hypothetical protein